MNDDIEYLIDEYAQDESVKLAKFESALQRKLDEIMREVLDAEGNIED